MKYIKRIENEEGYIKNCLSSNIMLEKLQSQEKALPPQSLKWVLDKDRYELHNSKTLKDFYLHKIAITSDKAVVVFADDVYFETFTYLGLVRHINRPIESKLRMSHSEVARVLMDEIVYDEKQKLITHAIRLRSGELYFKSRDIEYKRTANFNYRKVDLNFEESGN